MNNLSKEEEKELTEILHHEVVYGNPTGVPDPWEKAIAWISSKKEEWIKEEADKWIEKINSTPLGKTLHVLEPKNDTNT